MNSHYGITYETERHAHNIRVWCYGPDGLIKRRYETSNGIWRTRDYHVAWSEAGVKRTLEVLYWHRLRNDEDPLGDVQDMVCAELERKTQKIYQEARHENWKARRERRAARAYGCAEEQLHEHEIESMNHADPGTIGV